jgi:phosphopantothenoylcysteine decarboxylase
MAKILLGVTGSVAAIKTPALVAALLARGHEVKVVATQSALYFFAPDELPARTLFLDSDEWPGRAQGRLYQRGDDVLHIELRRWAELFLIAPLDANTLAKLSLGLSDNCLTCVYRAWDAARPVLLAPAMNTLMWENPLTAVHLRALLGLLGVAPKPSAETSQENAALIAQINEARGFLRVVPPIEKRLACGDLGVGAMAELSTLVEAVESSLVAR